MSLLAKGTFNGLYEASEIDEVAGADYLIGHEFASHEDGIGKINYELAEIIADRYLHMEIYVARSIAKALKSIAPKLEIAVVFNGISSNTSASQGGTWVEIQQAIDMVGNIEKRPLHIAQAYHIGRVALHSKKAGLNPIIPKGMPTDFDPDSEQWWCRRPLLWAAREIPGSLFLRHLGQL